MTKLRAIGPDADDDALTGLAPRVRAAGDSYAPLLAAVTDRRRVAFRYRAASTGIVSQRHIEPWRIVVRGGGWYVVGHDIDRGTARVFRLSRIEGRIRAVGPPGQFEIPEVVDVDAAMGTVGVQRPAILAVVPERASALRARAVAVPANLTAHSAGGARDAIAVPFASVTTFAEEVAGYGAAVVVLDPPELRAEVIRRLEAAAALDGAQPAGRSAGPTAAPGVPAVEADHG
jgi:proteasome accessory factor B